MAVSGYHLVHCLVSVCVRVNPGGESIWGKKFKDERPGLSRKHDRPGVLSMCNSGKHTNTSQFFLTFAAAPQCDGKHVVFGQVVSGLEVLRSMSEAAAACSDTSGQPDIVITECGLLTADMATQG